MDTPVVAIEAPPSVFKLFPLVERVVIAGKYLNNRIKQSIENCLRNLVEGVCSRHGFVKPGSISIRSYGEGHISTESGGSTAFQVEFDALVCNPTVGSIVSCRIEAMNSFAAFAVNVSDDVRVLEIIVPPTPKAFVHDQPFSDLKVGSAATLRIVGKRFNLGQKTIVCAGQIVSCDKMAPPSVDPPVVSQSTRVEEDDELKKPIPEPVAVDVATDAVDHEDDDAVTVAASTQAGEEALETDIVSDDMEDETEVDVDEEAMGEAEDGDDDGDGEDDVG